MAFGAQLRQCRQAAGLSLRQLAGRVGYDHSYLSQVERGQRPGSADLARLCDGELGTGDRLVETYRRTSTKARTGTPAMRTHSLETAWQQLTTALPDSVLLPQWPDQLDELRRLPAARRLPELVSRLSTLQTDRQAGHDARQAELSVWVAETLTACGRVGEARRWWWAARQLADGCGDTGLSSLVRSREATSGLSEGRALSELLPLADEALALALQEPLHPDHLLGARAVRARILAGLGRVVEAHEQLPEVLSYANELPSASTGAGQTPYEVHAVEGSVCASLGYWTAGCLMFARALELCPSERLEERALLELGMAECFAGGGQGPAALALALRVLIELPDEWHTTYVYGVAERVLAVVRSREPRLPGLHDLDRLLAAEAWGGRTVGSESSSGLGRE
ncbi:helix-turn-helix transcriptional regulator [Kribbella sp. NPDC005582]|uniref:helix-turn-helix domain-containing protein n=1 Tax=Kribbella sp. NPDC005582 TaxID=3156893 RepID=UPI0033A184F6